MTRARAFLVLIPLAGSAVGQTLTEGEQAMALTSVHEYVRSYTASLPNYTCLQITQEIFGAWPGLKPGMPLPIRTDFHTDVIEEQISFVDGKEMRTVTKINGSGPLSSGQAQIGPVAHGEFGTLLYTIFDPLSGADIRWKRAATLDRRRVNVFEFRVPQSSGWSLVGSKGRVKAPFEGLVYADRETGTVVQIEMKCTGIPSSSEYKSMNLRLDYKPAKIAGREHLLPSGFVIHYKTITNDATIGAEFKSCRQFSADSTLTFERDSSATGAAAAEPAPAPEPAAVVTEIPKTAPRELPPAPVAEAKAPPTAPSSVFRASTQLVQSSEVAQEQDGKPAAGSGGVAPVPQRKKGGAQQPPDPAVFHSETRLVEVEVVVRDQRVRPPGLEASLAYYLDSGPPFGPAGALLKNLTKDDFTLLDQGKPQPIAVFRIGPSLGATPGEVKPIALPPGAVSNRQDSGGQPINNATAVLMDFLNTEFDYTGYERVGVTNLLRSLGQTGSRVALYTLGENLHMLHDFTDDSQRLVEIAAKLGQKHDALPADLKSALRDYGDLLTLDRDEAAGVAAQVHARMTTNALNLITQHLSGVPGRKNLVWLMDDPHNVPPAVMDMLLRANIVLYPVLVRTVRVVGGPLLPGNFGANALAAATGGRAFFDARDLTYAVEAAEEDSHAAYVLGYYAPAGMLDGKYHQITVKIHGKAPNKQTLEVHYRPGYLATKVAVPATAPTPEELYEGRVNSARIGLVGQATPDAQHPGSYEVRLTVDLHDIQLGLTDGHFTGAFEVSVPKPSAKGAVMTGSVAVSLTDEQLAKALENGFPIKVAGAEPESGEIRVVVRDRATGTAGSLRVPVPKQ